MQNYKKYAIPRAQLVIADVPYCIGSNFYGSRCDWYINGDNKNGESKLAGKAAFNSDFNFNLYEYFHFCSKMLKKEPKKAGARGRSSDAPCMIVFCSFEQIQTLINAAAKHGFVHYIPLVFIKNYSPQVLKANMRVVGATEYALVFYRDKLPKFRNGSQTDENGNRLTMWNLIPRKLMPPTRIVRYCCSELKEGGNPNRMIATGVRWSESSKRSNRSPFEVLGQTASKSIGVSDEKMLITDNDCTRRLFENCQMKAKTVVNPIIDWIDQNIWQFIGEKDIQVCELYQCGYNRLGFLGCPLASKKQREKEMYDFPKYKQAYIRAFDRMIEERKRRGKDVKWSCGEEVYLWWMQDNNVVGQMELSDFIEY